MNSIYTKLWLTTFCLFSLSEVNASDFFLKINRAGQHTVLVADQYQTNLSNIYRFFELSAGAISVKVSDGSTGNLVYDGSINLAQNQRIVAEMDANGNVTIVNTLNVTWNNWYTDNVEGTVNNQNTPPPPTPPTPGNAAVTPEKFKEMKKIISDQIADNYKVEKAKSMTKKNALTSKQIAEICNLMDFDNYKLDYAKFAYDFCVDKSNYFELSSVFSFQSYSQELDKYVDGKN